MRAITQPVNPSPQPSPKARGSFERLRLNSNMTFSDETIFITGFPGFIASRLIKRLAAERVRFILLVQPALLERAREEVAQIANETGTARADFQIV